MKKTSIFVTKVGFGLAVVLLFAGCDFGKKTEKEAVKTEVKSGSTGPTLLSIDGKVAIKESDFNKHLTQMVQMHPYFRGASPDSLPKPIQRQFFDQLIKQELIVAYADKNNFEKDPEFQKAFDEMKDLVKRSLLIQRFEAKVLDDIKVSDSEIKDHFAKNKDKYIKEPGGVTIEAISFKDSDKATDFLNKVKGKESDFVKLAKDEKAGEFKDFGRVSKQDKGPIASDIPQALKDKAFALRKTPGIEKVEADKLIWVFKASDKKDDEVFKLDEIKPQLEQMLKANKAREIIEDKLTGLRKDFTIDVNEDYFKEAIPKVEESSSAATAA